MNNSAAQHNQSDDHDAPDLSMMRFGTRLIQRRRVYSVLGIVTALLFMLTGYLGLSYRVPQDLSELSEGNFTGPLSVSVEKGATGALIKNLKYWGLWEIPEPEEVPRFFIKSYPEDLHTVQDISVKKRVFLHSLLPHALYVRQEALQRREKLESILGKINCNIETLDFGNNLEYENQCSWTDFLAENDVNFIQNLCKKYRTTSAEVLLERVDAIPTSIILAQGALESSWGSSRFTREGNSIFGMWTWKTPGIVPSEREEGKTHKVKVYQNILESVRAYHLTLNRLESYDEFRKLRQYTDNPLILAEGLTLYSERGKDYVEDIKKVILSNNLQKYDSCSLDDLDLPVSSIVDLVETGKASL